MAHELGKDKIRVNTIAPAWTETDMADKHLERLGREKVAAQFPLGRIGQADDVAKATIFLLSKDAEFIHRHDGDGGRRHGDARIPAEVAGRTWPKRANYRSRCGRGAALPIAAETCPATRNSCRTPCSASRSCLLPGNPCGTYPGRQADCGNRCQSLRAVTEKESISSVNRLHPVHEIGHAIGQRIGNSKFIRAVS